MIKTNRATFNLNRNCIVLEISETAILRRRSAFFKNLLITLPQILQILIYVHLVTTAQPLRLYRLVARPVFTVKQKDSNLRAPALHVQLITSLTRLDKMRVWRAEVKRDNRKPAHHLVYVPVPVESFNRLIDSAFAKLGMRRK